MVTTKYSVVPVISGSRLRLGCSISRVRRYSDGGESTVDGPPRGSTGVKTGRPLFESPRVLGETKLLSDLTEWFESLHGENTNGETTLPMFSPGRCVSHSRPSRDLCLEGV